jgi:hypothetical protein
MPTGVGGCENKGKTVEIKGNKLTLILYLLSLELGRFCRYATSLYHLKISDSESEWASQI